MSRTFFVANVGGLRLGVSDGTASGAHFLKTLTGVAALTSVGGKIYFGGNDGSNTLQPWVSDGTVAGTFMLKNVVQNTGGSAFLVDNFIDVNGAVFFTTSDFSADGLFTGARLWKTDGTTAGTMELQHFSHFGSQSLSIANLNGMLVFAADDGIHGTELWRSDGDGTALVKDIFPGADNSIPRELFTFKNKVYFSAEDGVHGSELWRSDGTAAGTIMVKNLNPGDILASAPHDFTAVGDIFYFAARGEDFNYELWRSDGTGSGTVRLKVFDPGAEPTYLTKVGGMLLFSADDEFGRKVLWRSDGAATNTVIVKDRGPGFDGFSGPFDGLNPGNYEYTTGRETQHFAVLNDIAYFIASETDLKNAVWRSDGTDAGTFKLTGFNPGGGSVSGLKVVDQSLEFVGAGSNFSEDLYRATPTGSATFDVVKLATGVGDLFGLGILDDAPAPAGSVAINDVSISEGNSGTKVATFTVTRSDGTAAFDLNFATADGSATVADQDYAANSGTLHFGDGVNSQTISVIVNGDTKVEPGETFIVNLSGATNGATIGDNQGVGTIASDEFFAQPAVKLAGALNPGNGWTSQDQFPRHLADVNHDGNADIVAFGNGGVYVSLANGDGSFAAPAVTLAGSFNPANGWTSDDAFHRELADVNGDHMADIIGFGNGGVYVSLATGGGNFAPLAIKLAAFNPANGWTSQDQFPRQLADVNGDHMADIVGFGNGGAYVALATGDGNFATPIIGLSSALNPGNGWTTQHQFPRELADVNHDGMADIVGFGNGGVYVSLATGGGHFASPTIDIAAFNPVNGWTGQDAFPRQLADVNGDAQADIVAFGNPGVLVALANDFHLI